MIAVEPTAQRNGIATRLTVLALDEMRARDLDLAFVSTGGDPGARARPTDVRKGRVHRMPRRSGTRDS